MKKTRLHAIFQGTLVQSHLDSLGCCGLVLAWLVCISWSQCNWVRGMCRWTMEWFVKTSPKILIWAKSHHTATTILHEAIPLFTLFSLLKQDEMLYANWPARQYFWVQTLEHVPHHCCFALHYQKLLSLFFSVPCRYHHRNAHLACSFLEWIHPPLIWLQSLSLWIFCGHGRCCQRNCCQNLTSLRLKSSLHHCHHYCCVFSWYIIK